ncbi:hypothetical protein HanRHA438_Chr05g0213641 [Helianthus annuus]|nr:hypothetical protein HanIR_Chr05g0220131 [Helianthus annuus]KAJ0749575.1 hypothetical protein HanLR1_Chr05g0171481 [Helianthus annuus]KAJ0918093.1 hypothetical protein HanRHA438_Chr05g0213641 [Helianthus annuus]
MPLQPQTALIPTLLHTKLHRFRHRLQLRHHRRHRLHRRETYLLFLLSLLLFEEWREIKPFR